MYLPFILLLKCLICSSLLCVLSTHLSALFVSLSLIFHDPFDSEFIFFLIKAVFFTIPIAPIFGI